MQSKLQSYIPENVLSQVLKLLEHDHLVVKIKNERKTRHGDYMRLPNGKHQITINSNLNKYRFLITLIHEIAHFEAYKNYGRFIKPHGIEWKRTFQHLMLPFLNPKVFPSELLPLLAKHFKNPKASSDTDISLALELKKFDEPNNKTYIFEVPLGSHFKLYNGKIFKMGLKRVKRYECIEIKTGRLYLFNPNAEVELLKDY
ncbi:SprT-like domain-containing protein [Litoribaculum gwangyangense]|uniref:SprT-like domain-containing protein n=1 Tax=Litoribaculum gwangyangense TaxID=1130722 RepID=A0ABP9CB51_9FLAO